MADVERLRKHLLSFGGDEDAGFKGIQRPEVVALELTPAELGEILDEEPLDPIDIEFVPMEVSQCHTNCQELAAEREDLEHWHGFALSDDGVWRSHSWLVDEQGGIVETTEVRELYLGIPCGRKQ